MVKNWCILTVSDVLFLSLLFQSLTSIYLHHDLYTFSEISGPGHLYRWREGYRVIISVYPPATGGHTAYSASVAIKNESIICPQFLIYVPQAHIPETSRSPNDLGFTRKIELACTLLAELYDLVNEYSPNTDVNYL